MVKIVEPKIEIMTPLNESTVLKLIEKCARNCYKSEDKITDESAIRMVKKLIEMNHTAMLEFFDITVKLTCDLGAYKDLTRHRHCSFAIESTRYCNYSKGKYGNELTFIRPCNIPAGSEMYNEWFKTMEAIEKGYLSMSKQGALADQLRMLLPHSIKADVIMKANIREWRYLLNLRCSSAPHPSVQQIMSMVLKAFKIHLPVLFDDIYPEIQPEKDLFQKN